MYYQLISDFTDYTNTETGESQFSIEWEFDNGSRWWEQFNSREEMELVLNANEAFNSQPEVAAQIKADQDRDAIWYDMYQAEWALETPLEIAVENSSVIELARILKYSSVRHEKAIDFIVSQVLKHNKAILKARVLPQSATYTLSEVA
jgi:hypothetical protein